MWPREWKVDEENCRESGRARRNLSQGVGCSSCLWRAAMILSFHPFYPTAFYRFRVAPSFSPYSITIFVVNIPFAFGCRYYCCYSYCVATSAATIAEAPLKNEVRIIQNFTRSFIFRSESLINTQENRFIGYMKEH